MAETEGAEPRVERPRSELKRTMAAYRETFRRHRRPLSLPIILAVFIAAWSVLGAPKSYQSTADLWVDNPVSTSTSLGNADPAVTPPAQQEQSLIAELLTTRDFRLAVGHQSQLARYLAHNSTDGWGPSGLLSAIGGDGSLSTRILGALGASQVLTTVSGPQVLQISYRGPTPAVAASTLRSLITQLQTQSTRLAAVHTQDSISYYSAQVQTASKQLSTARQQVAAYLQAHPGATTTNDQTLQALTAAQTIASGTLTRATTNLNGATGSGPNGGGGTSGSLVQEIDQPTVPTGAVSGKKKDLLAIIGGLFAGALISFLGLVALTPGRRDTWGEEIAGDETEQIPVRPRPIEPAPAGPATAHTSNGSANRPSPNGRSDDPTQVAAAANGHRGSEPKQANGNGHVEPEPASPDAAPSKHTALAHARAATRPARLEEFIQVVRNHPGITIPDAARRMDVHRDSLYRVRDRAQRAGKIRADGSHYFPTEHRRESSPEGADDRQS